MGVDVPNLTSQLTRAVTGSYIEHWYAILESSGDAIRLEYGPEGLELRTARNADDLINQGDNEIMAGTVLADLVGNTLTLTPWRTFTRSIPTKKKHTY